MEQVNSFSKGLSKDITKTFISKDVYRDARNIRIFSSGLDSTGALINTDGNSLLINFPNLSNVLKLQIIGAFPLTVSFNLNGVVISGLVNSYQDIASLINNDSTLSLPVNNIKAAASLTQVLIWGALANNLVSSISVNSNSFTWVNVTITNLISSQSGLRLCGWGLIREDIILFTTNSSDKNPGGHDTKNSITDPTSVGQIWKLTYNVVNPVTNPVLTLLYNNYTDFTTYFSFREEGQVEGRYENTHTKTIYWTDNFTTLRRFNTADPNGFAIDVSLLDYKPSIEFDVPILQKINDSGGLLKVGMYQAAYRLTNFGGANTIYSKPSNMVPIVNLMPDSEPFIQYTADGASNSGKSITWNIDNIDTDFQRIEIVVLYRTFRNDIAVIDQVFDEPIPESGNFTFTYTGSEPPIPVDLNTFLDVSSAFTHCKTITSKDNLLLVGNTRNETFDVDFDARAYRFNSNTINRKADLADFQGNITATILAASVQGLYPQPSNQAWLAISETHDARNPDQFDQTVNGYRFQSDGTTLGGEGPNIKYTFVTKFFQSDYFTAGNGFAGSSLDISAGPIGKNGRVAPNQPTSFPLNNNSFKNNNFYESFRSPYISSAFKGYQPDEIYPFAIQFFDLQGRPGFAKWIGDIRCPLIYEQDGSGSGAAIHFPITKLSAVTSWQEIGILLPEFTVTIPNLLKDKISGWQIVRCERTTADKTVLASGILRQSTFEPSQAGNVGFYTINGGILNTYQAGGTLTGNIASGTEKAESETSSLVSPDFLFTQFPGHKTGDTLKVVCMLNQTHGATATNPPPNVSGGQEIKLIKYYTTTPVVFPDSGTAGRTNIRTLDNAVAIPKGGTVTSGIISGNRTIYNGTMAAFSSISSPSLVLRAIGQTTVFLEWQASTGLYFGPGMPGGGNDPYYCFYTRVVSKQYGGNSYSERSNREYISTGQYQEITLLTTNLTFTTTIAGGDIFTTIFDVETAIADANTNGNDISLVQWFPVHTTKNTEWRHGNYINKNGITANAPNQIPEDFSQYNDGFSHEDNTRKAFPKPINFQNIQENDNRIYASAFKINGETTDSWGIFPPFDFQDVDGKYGPINNLQILQGNVFGLQDKGIFYIPINQKVTVPDNANSALLLGTGEKLTIPQYITTSSGCKHQFGNIVTDRGLYYFDIDNFKLNKVTKQNEKISVIAGLDGYFKTQLDGDIRKTDKPNYSYGIIATYDQNNHDVLFTFHDSTPILKQNLTTAQNTNPNSETISFNELSQSFVSFYDYFPKLYINDKTHIITPNNTVLSQLWMHSIGNPGQFYGTTYPSSVSLLISPNSKESVFDNFYYITEVKDLSGKEISNETWGQIRVSNDYQNSDYQTLTVGTNIKRKKRVWQMALPRNIVVSNIANPDIFLSTNLNPAQTFINRIRGSWIQVDLKFPNIVNSLYRKLIMSKFVTLFRFSAR